MRWTSTSRSALLALLTIVAVLVSACGGGSDPPTRAEFEEAVVVTRDRVDFALERITKASSMEEFLERMKAASGAIDDAAKDMEAVGAPEPFAEDTNRLVKALAQLSVDLSATASDLERPEVLGELASGARGINFESWDEANRALAALIGLGIDVALIERH